MKYTNFDVRVIVTVTLTVNDLHVIAHSHSSKLNLLQSYRYPSNYCGYFSMKFSPLSYKLAILFYLGYTGSIFMRPSSLGGGRIFRRTLSVRLSRYCYRASRRAT